MKKLLAIKDVAEILGVSLRTLYGWSSKGRNLRFRKIGKFLRVTETDLQSFIDKKNQPRQQSKNGNS